MDIMYFTMNSRSLIVNILLNFNLLNQQPNQAFVAKQQSALVLTTVVDQRTTTSLLVPAIKIIYSNM